MLGFVVPEERTTTLRVMLATKIGVVLKCTSVTGVMLKLFPDRPLMVTGSVSMVTVSPFCQPVASVTVILEVALLISPLVARVCGVLAAQYTKKLPPLLMVKLLCPVKVPDERIRLALMPDGMASDAVPISNVPLGNT